MLAGRLTTAHEPVPLVDVAAVWDRPADRIVLVPRVFRSEEPVLPLPVLPTAAGRQLRAARVADRPREARRRVPPRRTADWSNLGGSAAPTATFDSATLRSRCLQILGYTNTELTAEQQAGALDAVLGHAAAGRLTVEHETVPFHAAADAWARQARGAAARRIVLTFT